MHEAGVAASIAFAIREHAPHAERWQLIVRGIHGDADAFDAALRAHLEAEIGGAAARLSIVHAPMLLTCSSCIHPFEAADADAECPRCGEFPLPAPGGEAFELHLDEAAD